MVNKINSIKILGIRIDNVDFKQAIKTIQGFIQSKKPHQVITVNPEFIMLAQKDAEFKKVLSQGDLVVPDGIGVVWASKIFGKGLRERVTGVDLVERLSELASKKKYSIYFLGGEKGVASKAAAILKKKNPGLKIVGAEPGFPHDPDLVERVRKAKPDILFVAWRFPKAEKWIAKYKNRLGATVGMGVGGAFDFISQKKRRAPVFIQSIGLEWLYRLIREPSRIRRQIVLPCFVYLVLRDFVKNFNSFKKR